MLQRRMVWGDGLPHLPHIIMTVHCDGKTLGHMLCSRCDIDRRAKLICHQITVLSVCVGMSCCIFFVTLNYTKFPGKPFIFI